MTRATVDELLADGQLEPEEVELPSGRTLLVRGLTVEEVRAIDSDNMQRGLLATGIIDPPMTLEQVDLWRKRAPAGDPTAAAAKIQELSGMLGGSAKAAYKRIREEFDARVRPLPSGAARDDGGEAASGDDA